MLLEPTVINEFAIGAAAGLGHSLGTRVLNWISASWGTWTRGKSTESLLRRVRPADLKGGIPEGMQLCRFRGDQCVETSRTAIPQDLRPEDSLWLIPVGTVWVPTELTCGTESAAAEVAVEFDPAQGLHHLLRQGDGVTATMLGAFVASGLMGVLNVFGTERWTQVLGGDANATTQCLAAANRSLEQRGVRCQGLRHIQSRSTIAQADTDAATAQAELAETIEQLKTPQDWQAVPQALANSGLPLDRTAEEELRAMQDEVLQRQLSSAQAANRLAALTAAALTRAGIDAPDINRWRTAAAKLERDEPTPPAAVATAAVDPARRPGTWWIWDRTEVDRRLQRYLRRLSQHSRTGLEQALLTVSEMSALRKLRDLQTQITMLDELLATLPTAEPRTRGLRLEGAQVKEAVQSLQTAVTQAEALRSSIDTLLRTPIDQPTWTTAWSNSTQAATLLTQHVRDRRIVR